MGGNGTFAAGNIAKYRWETVDSYNGVKVLRPVLPPGQKRIQARCTCCYTRAASCRNFAFTTGIICYVLRLHSIQKPA